MSIAPSDPWNYDRYARLPEDGLRHEIIAGIHFVTPAPSIRHQQIATRLIARFQVAVEALGEGWVLAAPCDVLLTDVDTDKSADENTNENTNENVVQPDLVFVSPDRSEIVTEKYLCGAPSLVVEILSESTWNHDRTTKRELYADHGVEEFWLVDPTAETVTVLRPPAKGEYTSEEIRSVSADTLVTTPFVDGLEVDLAARFA